jgi:hypothetical protein
MALLLAAGETIGWGVLIAGLIPILGLVLLGAVIWVSVRKRD